MLWLYLGEFVRWTPKGGERDCCSLLIIVAVSSNLSFLFFPSRPTHAGTASHDKRLRYLAVTGSAAQTQGRVVFPHSTGSC